MVFCGLFGTFMAGARSRHEAAGAPHCHYFDVVACFTFAFGAFTSLMWDPFIAYPFFYALAFMVVVRGRRSLARNPTAATAHLQSSPGGAKH